MSSQPVSQHFPPRVREWLMQAACTPNPPWDPMARQKAINRAIEKAQALYPEAFRCDSQPVTD